MVRRQPRATLVVSCCPLTPLVRSCGITAWGKAACRKLIHDAGNEVISTPLALQGPILWPCTGGGVNWGGLAFDAGRQVMFVNTSSAMHLVTLIPADKVKAARAAEPDAEISPNTGAPYGMRRVMLASPFGLPRSEEHKSELQSLMRISYAGLCSKKKTINSQ